MIRFLIVALALLVSAGLFAHPEDDFCEPGDDSMDPALCAALAELNSNGDFTDSHCPCLRRRRAQCPTEIESLSY
jgi:hypothetical protein